MLVCIYIFLFVILMINADKAAADLKPELIERLKKPTSKLNFTIEVV